MDRTPGALTMPPMSETRGMGMRVPTMRLVGAVALALAACTPASKGARPAPEAVASEPPAAAPLDPPMKAVTFTRRVPAPGSKAKQKRELGFQLSRVGNVMRHTAHDVIEYEVKQADASRVTQAGLVVKELFEANQQGDDPEEKTVNPLSGKRFVLTRNADGRMSALDAAGAALSDQAKASLEEHYGGLFEADKFGAFLPTRPIIIGEKVEPTRGALLEMMQIDDDDRDTSIDDVDFTLAGAENGQAKFEVGMTMTWAMGDELRMRAKLVGSVSVETATARLRTVRLTGPVVVLDAKGTEVGGGQFRAEVDVSSHS
jgi:hypothetical protein